jgi:hypothetical protein
VSTAPKDTQDPENTDFGQPEKPAKKRSSLKKVQGFPKSRSGTYLAVGTSTISAVRQIKKARTARGDRDVLKLVDALAKTAAVLTGIALLIRELRRMNDDDILTD